MNVHPRTLSRHDLPALMALVEAANWNQTPADWERLLTLCGPLAMGIERDGRIVASATLLQYDPSTAWLGMVLTLPEYRGQGFARQLLAALLDEAGQSQTIYLDATSQGETLYRHFGFVAEGVVRRWKHQRPAASQQPPNGAWDARLDQEAFGADRRDLLRLLAAESRIWSLANGSYACLRPGRLFAYLGPAVAADKESAAQVIESALAGASEVVWDVLDANPNAIELCASLGFTHFRRLVRMRRGAPIPARIELQYGLAGFEYG
jgi:GNAT superfamily N-acetyltransferase